MAAEAPRAVPGEELRARRRALGISRARLAGLIGRSHSSLAYLEQGARPQRSEVLAEALDALEILENDHDRGGKSAAVGKVGARDAPHAP